MDNASLIPSDIKDYDISYLVTIVWAFIISISIILINALTLVMIKIYDNNSQSHSMIIYSLIVNDMILGLFLLAAQCVITVYFNVEFCNLRIFVIFVVETSALNSSQWHTIALSIDRLVAVQKPLTYHSIMTPCKIKLLILLSWLVGTAEGICVGLLDYYSCLSGEGISPLPHTLHSLLILSLNGGIYCRLWLVARKQRKQIAQQNSAQPKVLSKATIMVIVIIGVFGVLWGPSMFCTLYRMLADDKGKVYIESVLPALVLLGYTNSIVNSFIYVLMKRTLRKKLGKLLRCSSTSM